jgi:hypothetical protein
LLLRGKKTSISIVVDIENSPSPTVVTRRTPTVTTIHLEGTTKKNTLVNEVVAFGGIAAPSSSVRRVAGFTHNQMQIVGKGYAKCQPHT